MSESLRSSVQNTEKPMEEVLNEAMEKLSVEQIVSNKSSPPKSLSDMPIDIVGLIVERSGFEEQLILRKVSKRLYCLVNRIKPSCKLIRVKCSIGNIYCEYDGLEVFYSMPTLQNLAYPSEFSNDVINDDYYRMAFADLKRTFKNRKLELDNLIFSVGMSRADPFLFVETCYELMNTVLDSLNHKLSVKKVEVGVTFINSLLPNTKPGVLQKIAIKRDGSLGIRWDTQTTTDYLVKLSELEQWKQATELELHFLRKFPLEYATHFKRLHIWEKAMSEIELLDIVNHLSTMPSFEYCTLHTGQSLIWDWDTYDIQELFGTPAPPNQMTNIVSHYMIPATGFYLEFQLFPIEQKIVIEKKEKKKMEKKKDEENEDKKSYMYSS